VVRSLVIGSILAVGLAVLLFVGLDPGSGPGAPGPVVGIGTTAPEFNLASLTGGAPVNLHAVGAAHHHPVILNFFASWCIPCEQETPLLARTSAHEQAKGSTIRFVGVDVNDPTGALAFVQRSGITYPVGVDPTAKMTSSRYGVYGLPQTFFIDATGTVIGHQEGAVSEAELSGWLHRLAGAAG
jgi:cytochrome c biogenesis protein CcmG/thiol:disulfide interchange protein DsbE